jgi:type I restriction enzyme M protein
MFGGIPNSEIADLGKYWDAFPTLKDEVFAAETDRPYSKMKVDDVLETLNANSDVQEFKARFNNAFEDLKRVLRIRLIDNVEQVKEVVESDVISTNIFARAEGLPLIDKYAAYQILADNWQGIMGDVEIIQTEGFGACNVVEAKYKIVKRDGVEIEEIDGNKGRIMPFDLVQATLLTDELASLERLKQEKHEQEDLLTELLEGLDVEEQDMLLNDDNTDYDKNKVNEAWDTILKEVSTPETELLENYLKLSKKADKLAYITQNPIAIWEEMEKAKDGTFSKKTISSTIAQLKSAYEFEEDTTESKVKRIVLLREKSSELGKSIKQTGSILDKHTEELIQALDMKQIVQLLEMKWIHPITSAIEAMPNAIIAELADAITALNEKYAVTYDEIETNISESEQSLAALICQLTGDEYAIKGLSNLIKK